MSPRPNILFIMCDQLRWDYLGCAGHPALQTPNIDALAARGVRFDRAYVQAPVCGPSRACTYTGRYVSSHGASWNGVPLAPDEMTMGDHLCAAYRVAVVGKTHLRRDPAELRRLGIDPGSPRGRHLMTGGFEPFDRDDGIHTEQLISRRGDVAYNSWLRSLGYVSSNPWHDFANSVETPEGRVISGWEMKSAPYPARLPAEHSETAYMTNRAIEFIDEAGKDPWLLHLSFIKPHWPYVAPAPYHALYSADDVSPAVRTETERREPHPVYGAFMGLQQSASFSRDTVREAVIPAYMGLITQIDDEIGRLMEHLAACGQLENTVVVFTSDHGDYLGDHWLGDKELFHDASSRVPLIIADPRASAQATHGNVVNDLVQSIDLLPTFLDLAGLPPDDQYLEGVTLAGYLDGTRSQPAHQAVLSEADYSYSAARLELGLGPTGAHGFMLRTDRWKYIAWLGYQPQLFDMQADPDEVTDLGTCPNHQNERNTLQALLFDKIARRRYRTTEADAAVDKRTAKEHFVGVRIGEW
ncbi:sulfatase-like hydrolase/transferase [Pararhodobacter oceanensis]|uniref:Phosphonate monoester hydrolase n=1 Tax=Pararhodobacter oceanensis TaxID=2172121 RepID=A0A2T8HQ48_9RHOB|nr:sulfatase-like hydrolase/transferase [Pararhodobacter oceanensis]PVH27402.1 phosphonate monoester hydrolase [Pararhodobacter oceanensis]